jgi:hypothetical protein
VPDPFPVDILETEVVEATNALGLSHFDLSIHKYPVRQLGGSGRRYLRTWCG